MFTSFSRPNRLIAVLTGLLLAPAIVGCAEGDLHLLTIVIDRPGEDNDKVITIDVKDKEEVSSDEFIIDIP